MLYSESLIEYYQLCSACSPVANRIFLQYVKDFTSLFRQMAIAVSSQKLENGLPQVKHDMKNQLQRQIRDHHYSRLLVDASKQEIISPFGGWLDAELRSLCSERMTDKVMQELVSEFNWLSDL